MMLRLHQPKTSVLWIITSWRFNEAQPNFFIVTVSYYSDGLLWLTFASLGLEDLRSRLGLTAAGLRH